MVSEAEIKAVEQGGKAISHPTRIETLLLLLEAEDVAEERAKAYAGREGFSESEVDPADFLEALGPKAFAEQQKEGLERRRKRGRSKKRKGAKKAKNSNPNLSGVSYHITQLVERFKILELAGTEQRRGAIAHFYRIKPDAKDAIRSLLKLYLD